MEETDFDDFHSDAQTLYCANMAGDKIVQVCPTIVCPVVPLKMNEVSR